MAIETKQSTVPLMIDPNQPPITSENPNLTYRHEWATCPVCDRDGKIGESLTFWFEKLGGHSSYCWFVGCKDLEDCDEEALRIGR